MWEIKLRQQKHSVGRRFWVKQICLINTRTKKQSQILRFLKVEDIQISKHKFNMWQILMQREEYIKHDNTEITKANDIHEFENRFELCWDLIPWYFFCWGQPNKPVVQSFYCAPCVRQLSAVSYTTAFSWWAGHLVTKIGSVWLVAPTTPN